ncbi:SET domain-containing protein 4 [Fopius arisanus]|uniref:SET domain-containing protein 4 n=1 Tax=Fopius arisanus TaxID=64838 RepID=A0A0C9QXA8_9HYME|nr:PREDICTED: SET domain-containing protein 4 [Fopius arisanus]
MGRTARIRGRKHKRFLDKSNIHDFSVLRDLDHWMRSLNWSPTCFLTPHFFSGTGRGLKCLELIPTYQVLMKIPRNLLITTFSISQSEIIKIFSKTRNYDPQTVLSVFLCFEKHLGDDSKWKYYIKSLPDRYTVPDYCKNNEKTILSSFILQDLPKQSQRVVNNYKMIVESINELRNRGNDTCGHCRGYLREILSFRDFKWGFYTVNTRAVYIDSSKNANSLVNIYGEDNLALAPFLDLFNHSYEASVDVGLEADDDSREFYRIRTLKPFPFGSQVFINYGAHSNAKLYLEYGFFIVDNPLDEIFIDYGMIERSLLLSKDTGEFIRTNGFDRSIGFSAEGFNYHGKIVLFVISTDLGQSYWKERIYRYDFSENEMLRIAELGIKLVNFKKMELIEKLREMKKSVNHSESFKIFLSLTDEYIYLCDKCLGNLTSRKSNN